MVHRSIRTLRNGTIPCGEQSLQGAITNTYQECSKILARQRELRLLLSTNATLLHYKGENVPEREI